MTVSTIGVGRASSRALRIDSGHLTIALSMRTSCVSLITIAESIGEDEVGIRLREVMEQEEFALEQVESAMAKLLAEKVESAR